eukprot:GHVP01029819.1.p1 GENE.GHVP01029819.1~~GHVP01029819.1.p1  ORF type:complete len:990 (+),score=179.63 GHVP01029819.1:3934-6903(+)
MEKDKLLEFLSVHRAHDILGNDSDDGEDLNYSVKVFRPNCIRKIYLVLVDVFLGPLNKNSGDKIFRKRIESADVFVDKLCIGLHIYTNAQHIGCNEAASVLLLCFLSLARWLSDGVKCEIVKLITSRSKKEIKEFPPGVIDLEIWKEHKAPEMELFQSMIPIPFLQILQESLNRKSKLVNSQVIASKEILDVKLKEFWENKKPDDHKIRKVYATGRGIIRTIERFFPETVAVMVGSWISGLALRNSEVDILILTTSSVELAILGLGDPDGPDAIKMLDQALRSNKFCGSQELDAKSRETSRSILSRILQAHLRTKEFWNVGDEENLSFSLTDPNDSGSVFRLHFENDWTFSITEQLRIMCSENKRVHQLICLVKEWAASRQINSRKKGFLSGYDWTLLVIHFLQHYLEWNTEFKCHIPVLPNKILKSTRSLKLYIGNQTNLNSTLDPNKIRTFISRSALYKTTEVSWSLLPQYVGEQYRIAEVDKEDVINIGEFFFRPSSTVFDLFYSFFEYLTECFDWFGNKFLIGNHPEKSISKHFHIEDPEKISMEELKILPLMHIYDPLLQKRLYHPSYDGQNVICNELLRAFFIFSDVEMETKKDIERIFAEASEPWISHSSLNLTFPEKRRTAFIPKKGIARKWPDEHVSLLRRFRGLKNTEFEGNSEFEFNENTESETPTEYPIQNEVANYSRSPFQTDYSQTDHSRSPPQTDHSRSPPQTDHSRSPSQTDHSRTPPQTDHSRIPAQTNYSRTDHSRTPSQTYYSQTDHSRTPPQTDHSRSPSQTDHSRTPAQTDHSRTPPQTDHSRIPAQTNYSRTDHSRTPSQTYYSQTDHSRTPSQTYYSHTDYSRTPSQTDYSRTDHSRTPSQTDYSPATSESGSGKHSRPSSIPVLSQNYGSYCGSTNTKPRVLKNTSLSETFQPKKSPLRKEANIVLQSLSPVSQKDKFSDEDRKQQLPQNQEPDDSRKKMLNLSHRLVSIPLKDLGISKNKPKEA